MSRTGDGTSGWQAGVVSDDDDKPLGNKVEWGGRWPEWCEVPTEASLREETAVVRLVFHHSLFAHEL